MKIAIVGYGKMGKEVERAARERNIAIAKIFTGENNRDGIGLTTESLGDVDICIEFTSPHSVIRNIKSTIAAGKNMVVGTTGWYDHRADVETLVKKQKTGLVYAPNFSLGVNLFYHIADTAAKIFDKFENYDVAISETHHKEKTDSPSGTALALGSMIVKNIRRKTEIFHETAQAKIKPDLLHVTSTRVGNVVGRHALLFDSDADSIELIHSAKNRRGFALGALIAAEWLKGKQGFYTMEDVIASLT